MSQWEGNGNVADKYPELRWVVLGVDETNLLLCSQEKTEREVRCVLPFNSKLPNHTR